MKAKIMLGCLMAAAMFTTSCSDFLEEDPKGKLEGGSGYATQKSLDAALVSVYAQVNRSQIYTNMQYPQWQGDDITANPGSNKQACAEMDAFSASGDNKGLTDAWKYHYTIIKACNQVLNTLKNTGESITQEEKNIAEGQAKFWRAYAYYYLVRLFGPLPILENDDLSSDKTPLTDVAGVYAQIERDLEDAERLNLPTSYSTEPRHLFGVDVYVTQQAVKSTLSAVYMSMAGYPLNKEGYYAKAANKAKEVIDGTKNGTYNITMDTDWKNVYSMANNYNTETILGINFSPIADWATDSELSSCCTFESLGTGGWGDAWGEIKFWKNYPDGPRKRAVYDPQILKNVGTEKEPVYQLFNWWDRTVDAEGNTVAAISEEHPMFSVFTVNADAQGNPIIAPYDYRLKPWGGMCNDHRHRLIRYPEVLLWYAESAARAGMDLTEAKECLLKVRQRAVDGDYTQVNGVPIQSMDANQLAEAAYNEHGWEVAGYWVALVTRRSDEFRMDRLKDNFEYRKANAPLQITEDYQAVEKVPVKGTWGEDRIYLPYPTLDAEKNPNLKR